MGPQQLIFHMSIWSFMEVYLHQGGRGRGVNEIISLIRHVNQSHQYNILKLPYSVIIEKPLRAPDFIEKTPLV